MSRMKAPTDDRRLLPGITMAVPRDAPVTMEDVDAAIRAEGIVPTPAQLYAQAAPSVVALRAKGEDDNEIVMGSGFLIQAEGVTAQWKSWLAYKAYADLSKVSPGLVLANYHVIRAAVSIEVTLADGGTGKVEEMVSENEKPDLALLLAMVAPAGPLLTLGKGTGGVPAIGTTVSGCGPEL